MAKRRDQLTELIGELASCPTLSSVATWPGLECDPWSTTIGWRRRRDLEAALYTGGFCEECHAPRGRRTSQPLVAREFDGSGPVIGLSAGSYSAVAATREFLGALTPHERDMFDTRPIDTSQTPDAELYVELIPRERPLMPTRMWVLGGPDAPCPRCSGIRNTQHVIRDRNNHWITSFLVIHASTIPAAAGLFVVGGSLLHWKLLATPKRLSALPLPPPPLAEPDARIIPDNEQLEIMAVCKK